MESKKRKRARTADGKFKGDNPLTPDVNEAWEPVEASTALPKKNNYKTRKKISTSGNDTSGKYSKPAKVRPSYTNNVKVISH